MPAVWSIWSREERRGRGWPAAACERSQCLHPSGSPWIDACMPLQTDINSISLSSHRHQYSEIMGWDRDWVRLPPHAPMKPDWNRIGLFLWLVWKLFQSNLLQWSVINVYMILLLSQLTFPLKFPTLPYERAWRSVRLRSVILRTHPPPP